MDFIDDFIKEYKCSPCLWKADSADFKNRNKRQEAYLKLIDVATKHGEHYNVERTKQKINNLRCAFRHQLKKYTELKKKGGEKYEPYCPKRRYFESLMFLKDEESPDKRIKREPKPPPPPQPQTNYVENNSVVAQIENSDEFNDTELLQTKVVEEKLNNSAEFCTNVFDEVAVTEPILRTSKSGVTIKEVEVIMPTETMELDEGKTTINISNNMLDLSGNVKEQIEAQLYEYEKEIVPSRPKKGTTRKRSSSMSSQVSNDTETMPTKPIKADISTMDFERLLSLAFKSVSSNMDDHFSSFGKIVAHKLRSMEPTQAIYAEKIIADVLYQGQMKMLSTLSIHNFLSVDSPNVYGENHNK